MKCYNITSGGKRAMNEHAVFLNASSHSHNSFWKKKEKKMDDNKKNAVSIKRREIRRASKRAGSRRIEEQERGRRRKTWEEERTRVASHRPAISWEESPPPPPLPSFTKLRDETGSRSWRETPANGTSSSVAVWNAVRRSFDNASGNQRAREERAFAFTARDACSSISLSLSLSCYRTYSQIHRRIICGLDSRRDCRGSSPSIFRLLFRGLQGAC